MHLRSWFPLLAGIALLCSYTGAIAQPSSESATPDNAASSLSTGAESAPTNGASNEMTNNAASQADPAVQKAKRRDAARHHMHQGMQQTESEEQMKH